MERKIKLAQETLDDHFDGDEDRVNDAFDSLQDWCEEENLDIRVNSKTNEVTISSQEALRSLLVAAAEFEGEGMSDDYEVVLVLLSEKIRDEDDYGEDEEDDDSEEDEEFEDDGSEVVDDLASSSAVKWFSWMNKARAPPKGDIIETRAARNTRGARPTARATMRAVSVSGSSGFCCVGESMERTITLSQESLDSHFSTDEKMKKAFRNLSSWTRKDGLDVKIKFKDRSITFYGDTAIRGLCIEAELHKDYGPVLDHEILMVLVLDALQSTEISSPQS